VLPQLFKINSPLLNSLGYDVALHAGTLLAILIYFRKKIAGLISGFFSGLARPEDRETPDFKMSINIIIATIPAVIAAVLFQKQIEGIFRNPVYTASALIIFGIILLLADRAGAKKNEMGKISAVDALIIGLGQALSIVPGVSRSGITITAGLFRGLRREDAAEFSFLLSAVAVAGAIVFEFKKLLKAGAGTESLALLAGFIAAFVSGMFAIKFMLAFVKKNSYLAFVIYRIALGAAIVVLVLKGA